MGESGEESHSDEEQQKQNRTNEFHERMAQYGKPFEPTGDMAAAIRASEDEKKALEAMNEIERQKAMARAEKQMEQIRKNAQKAKAREEKVDLIKDKLARIVKVITGG